MAEGYIKSVGSYSKYNSELNILIVVCQECYGSSGERNCLETGQIWRTIGRREALEERGHYRVGLFWI